LATDPLKLAELLWPNVTFFKEQKQIIYSVVDNDETFVPAGNMLGKDFVSGFLAVWFFLCHYPVRVVTTSVKDDHLRVLWGEIGRFIQEARYPLEVEKGGPFIVNHRDIRKVVGGKECKISYLHGCVSQRGEGMAGHHAKHTLLIIDEASGVDDVVYTQGDTWAKKKLIIGNPNPCTNFFFRGVKDGHLKAETNNHLYRNVIRVQGQDSPNVRLGLAQKKAGLDITDEELVPGVLRYSDYVKRRATWDPIRQCIGLDGEFYEGAEVLMFPPDWLNRAEQVAMEVTRSKLAKRTIGVDPAEGGDSTCWAVCDELGLIELISMKTPDTTVITSRTIALMRQYDVRPENVLFDRGGGGKEHADRLRRQGYKVRTVAFGEAASSEDKFTRRMRTGQERREESEVRYAYRNRRAEMYGLLRQMLDPAANERGFGLPAHYTELRRQLSPIPLEWDEEGRMILPPKSKRDPNSTKVTLTDLIGCSPDEADALVLAVFGLLREGAVSVARAI